MDEITYYPSEKTPGIYVARDHKGNVCGLVSYQTIADRKETELICHEITKKEAPK